MIRSRSAASFVRVVLACCALAAGVGGVHDSAQAQSRTMMAMSGMRGGMTMVEPDAVDEYARILGMDESQLTAAKALHEAYASDYQQATKRQMDGMKKIQEEFADSQDYTVWQRELPKVQKEYGERTEQLDVQFMNDVRSLLNESQSGKWVQVERAHRRRHALPEGALAGEGVDLVRILNEMKLEKMPDSVQQSLERYASELDAALQERERFQKEQFKKLESMRSGGPGAMDFEGMQKAITDVRKAGVPVRDINTRFASVIEGALPEASRAAFEQKFRAAKFPQIYGEAYLLKAAGAAEKFEDITPEQKATIAQIREAYLRDIEPANQAWATEQSKAEADGGGDEMISNWQRMMQGGEGGEQSPLAKARAARRKLDRDALNKLKEALNEAQIERLPERDDPFANQFRFGGGRRGR